MDEEWKRALSGFDAVWQRVSPRESGLIPAEPKQSGEGQLRDFLAAEAARTAYYSAVARTADGRCAEMLRSLSADCGKCTQKLKTEYFLLTGETWTAAPKRLQTDGLLGYLRRAYLTEEAAARHYGEAAAETENETLRTLYAELAECCTRRRESVRALVCRIMIA